MVKYGSVGVAGRFGPPELPIFCSILPEYFPRQAGHAYRVLSHQLADYEETLKKIAAERLPDISDLVEEVEPISNEQVVCSYVLCSYVTHVCVL